MRIIKSINNDWFFKKNFQKSDLKVDIDDSYQKIRLPHSNIQLSYSYFNEKSYEFISHYKRKITIDPQYKDKYISLHFEGVLSYCEIFFNHHKIGENKGGYNNFAVHLPAKLIKEENELCVVVDSTSRSDIPPFGNFVGFMTFGGIYREVQLQILDPIHLIRAHLTPQKVLEHKKELHTKITIFNQSRTKKSVNLSLYNKELDLKYNTTLHLSNKQSVEEFAFTIRDINTAQLWDLKNPKLYEFTINLHDGKQQIDNLTVKTGFRTVKFTTTGFYLNNNKIKLLGLNRHQSYPYVGCAMPKRVQAKDADILKYDLGLNIVRGAHYPQSRHFLDRCDEIGLLVIKEIPGWQHIGDELWQELSCANLENMINTNYNHPSIVLWGTRINESLDSTDFYTKTNSLAHSLDQTRQTYGSHFIQGAVSYKDFIEDVFGSNDFTHNGKNEGLINQQKATQLDYLIPYLVTEHTGHLFPTQKSDGETIQQELIKRHCKVINDMMLDENICGAIGWCAFDYNAASGFCASNRISHHGVMDIFRLPKFVAHFYRSQKDPDEEIVMIPMSSWSRGDQPSGATLPAYIATNCDYIELFFGDKKMGKYFPNKGDYKGLKHPPIILQEKRKHEPIIAKDFNIDWNHGLQKTKLVGYINNKAVAHYDLSPSPYLKDIKVTADDLTLNVGDLDATRVVVTAVDEIGNKLPYYQGVVQVDVQGAGSILGNNTLALDAGNMAFWIQNSEISGEIYLTVTLLEEARISKKLTITCS